MDIDVTGRIQNTRLATHHALLPVFEAIINSIHAIEALEDGAAGAIEIRVERDRTQPTQQVLGDEPAVPFPAKSFTVQDNGIGFTDANYKSFSVADSRQKANIGGKGVGRFLWLKAFDMAEIDSTFNDQNGDWKHRHFEFRLTPSGVEQLQLDTPRQEIRSTVVKLVNIRPAF
jgi:hypothetical protein